MLTRLRSGLAVSPLAAAKVLARRFDAPPLELVPRARRVILERFAHAEIRGGATYDAVVALEADAAGSTLLTLDERAQQTYRRLGIDFAVIAG